MINREGFLSLLIAGGIFLGIGSVFFKHFFTEPTIRHGIIVKKFHVENKHGGSGTVSGGRAAKVKINNSTHSDHDTFYKAMVRIGSDTSSIEVNCTAKHWDQLKVGDELYFKAFQGVAGTVFLAHNEDIQ